MQAPGAPAPTSRGNHESPKVSRTAFCPAAFANSLAFLTAIPLLFATPETAQPHHKFVSGLTSGHTAKGDKIFTFHSNDRYTFTKVQLNVP